VSKNVRFVLDKQGLIALMKSGEMQSVLNMVAYQAQSALGKGYEVEAAHPINFIAIASVRAKTRKAKLENNKDNTIEKAFGGIKL